MDRPATTALLPREALGLTDAGLMCARVLLVASYVVFAGYYLSWRIGVLNHSSPLWSAFVLIVEYVGFFWSLTFLLPAIALPKRRSSIAPGHYSVDVFVPTYNEPIDIVARTVSAAMAITYAHQTWLLDDGNRPEMRELALRLGCRYSARDKNTDAKAGNLNHGLLQSRADFIAIFDADHVAVPEFLNRTLGYFNDSNVAFVQTPQEFYNHDSHAHLVPQRIDSNEHSLFYRIIQRSRDRWNAAMFCGCAAVIRRSALDSIGGFATGTVTEDMHTSVRLHARGWHSVYHPEVLAAGIAPLDAPSFRAQRLRWAQGAMQVAWQERLFWRGGLSPVQRTFYLLHVFDHLEGWRNALLFLLPATVLLTGLVPIRTTFWEYVLHFAPYFALAGLTYYELGRDHGRFFESEVFKLARCATSIGATFAVFRKHLPFRVTPKIRTGQRPSAVYFFPWFVLVATVLAVATSVVSAFMARPRIPMEMIPLVGLWCLFSAGAAVRLILLSRRCVRNRRASTRLQLDLLTALTPFGSTADSVRASIVDATPNGLTIRPVDTSLSAGRYAGQVSIGNEQCLFTIDLATRRNGTLGGSVHWESEHSKGTFDMSLHQHAIRALAKRDRGDRGGFITRLAGASGLATALFVSLLALLNGTAGASGLVLTGTDASSTSSYTYAGAILPTGASAATDKIVLVAWADRLTYNFIKNGSRVSASSWGESISAGFQHSDGPNFVGLFVGADNRFTAMQPNFGLRNEGTHLSPRFQADLNQQLHPAIQLNLIAGDVTRTADYWTRGQVLFGKGVAVGPEYIVQGDTNYHAQRAGLAIERIPLGAVSLRIDAGSQHHNGTSGGYGGLSLSAPVQ